MTTDISPQAAPTTGSRGRVPTWVGTILVAFPPLMGISMALTMLTAPYPGSGPGQALLALWYIPEELFPVALVGVALILVGVRHDRRARKAAWLWTVLAVIGLVGTSGVAFLTGLNRSEDALAGSTKTAAEAAMAAFGLLYLFALIALVLLALRWLRTSLRTWARIGTILFAVTLVTSGSAVITGFVLTRGPNAPAGPMAMSAASDTLLWAVFGLIILGIVAARTRTMRGLVALAGTVLVAAAVTSKVLGAQAWRLGDSSESVGAASTTVAALTNAMAVVSLVVITCQVALLVAGFVLIRRTGRPAAA